VIHVLVLEFDEEHNGEVRFQIYLFLKKLQACITLAPRIQYGCSTREKKQLVLVLFI
jgi:hypothetical protein